MGFIFQVGMIALPASTSFSQRFVFAGRRSVWVCLGVLMAAQSTMNPVVSDKFFLRFFVNF
jgi:hypothetical protein